MAKIACLRRCCAPLTYLRVGRRDSGLGALRLGLEARGWCLACTCALMAALVALGLMSVTWMVPISVLITAEKL
jgi:predicted metal-binding membrane protein